MEHFRFTMTALALSAISSVWAITSMVSALLVSHLMSKKLNLTIVTGDLLNISFDTDTMMVWTLISMSSNVIFFYLAVRVALTAIRNHFKEKPSDTEKDK